MNLNKLFEIQNKLDQRIIEKHGLEGQDLLPMKILALQVELGELANEWRGFKFWSENQEPRVKIWAGMDYEDNEHGGISPIHGTDKYKNPLLEEYVDCLHFILSIGLKIGFNKTGTWISLKEKDLTIQFRFMFMEINQFDVYRSLGSLSSLLSVFVGLGEMLGFTWEQIEQAYLDKNQVNHTRQEQGY